MSSKGTSRRIPGTTESFFPDSYDIESAIIITNDGLDYDLTSIIPQIIIKESLNTPYLMADIAVVDATNLLEELKIIGNETIKLKIRRNPVKKSEQNKSKWELELKVAELHSYVRNYASKSSFKLKCISPHLYNNQGKVLRRPFSNNVSQLITDIIKKDLKVNDKRINTIGTTNKIMKGIYPTMKPINCANWLLKNAFDSATPFYLYETAKEGVHLQSYKALLDQDPFETYEFKPAILNTRGTPEHYNEMRKRIIRMTSPLNTSQFSNIGRGNYGATLYTFDIATKKKEKFLYDYETKKHVKLNKYKNYSNNDKIDNQTYHQLKDSKNYFISLNSEAFSGYGNYHNAISPTVMKGEAQLNNLDFTTVNIIINGDFDISVGKIVQLDISKTSSAQQLDQGRMVDKLLSGKYLVQDIEHSFKESFKQKITLKRDSLGVDIDA